MRILLVSPFFPPQNSIASLRPYSFAKFWKEAGHDIEVLTTKKEEIMNPLTLPIDSFHMIEVPMPKLFTRAKNNYKNNSLEKPKQGITKKLLFKGIDILRFKKGVFNACRMPDSTDLWAFRAFKKAKERPCYDVVVSSCGPYTAHIVAWRLKKNKKASFWVADYRDTWSNSYIYPGLFPLNLLEKALESKMLRDSDLVSTISTPFAETFSKITSTKTVTIENGFDPSDLKNLPKTHRFLRDGKIRIVHTGSIYIGKRDPHILFKAIKNLSIIEPKLIERLEVHFFGLRNANLDELIKREGVERWVHCSGFISREESLWVQRDADLLLFLSWDAPTQGVLTGKLFEYLFSKTPILSVGNGPLDSAEKLIEEFHAGHILKKEESITHFLKNVLSKEYIPKITIAPEYLKRFSRKELADKFLSLIQEQLKEKTDGT